MEIKQILHALGHPQYATPVKTDNATAAAFVNDLLKQKRSKAWDVRFHWLSEQQALKKKVSGTLPIIIPSTILLLTIKK